MSLGSGIEAVPGDVTKEDWLSGVQAWLSNYSARRLVVISAAQIGPIGPAEVIDCDLFLETLNVNVVGPIRVIRALVGLLGQDDRIVVLMGGGVGGPNPQPRVLAYTSSKAALAQLIESIGRDPDIHVPLLGLAPGTYATSFTDPVRRVAPEIAGAELLAQISTSASEQLDVEDLISALTVVCGPAGTQLTGRVLSAKRDSWNTLDGGDPLAGDMYRLRRVDGDRIHVDLERA